MTQSTKYCVDCKHFDAVNFSCLGVEILDTHNRHADATNRALRGLLDANNALMARQTMLEHRMNQLQETVDQDPSRYAWQYFLSALGIAGVVVLAVVGLLRLVGWL